MKISVVKLWKLWLNLQVFLFPFKLIYIYYLDHPKAKQELIKPGFVKSIIDLIEQRIKDKNTVIAGLKIISSILSTNEGYDLLKTESFGLKIIVKVLENYPEDKAVNSVK